MEAGEQSGKRGGTGQHGTLWLAGLLAVVAIFATLLLSLPCFPSADGPVHLYYAHVFGALLGGGKSPFAVYFQVRHLLPPYALYYYLLLALGHGMSLQTADEVVICLYFVSFALGFRYLARAIGPSAEPIALLATALLLNWPLGMGFVNFCLSLSFALWALGLWLRATGLPGMGRRVGFLLLVMLITLTHPVPLLLVLAVAGLLLAGRFAAVLRGKGGPLVPEYGVADVLTLGMAALSLVYVKAFAVAHPLAQSADVQPNSYWGGVARSFAGYAREHALAFVLGAGAAVTIYRLGLLVILVLTLGLAVQQRLRNRRLGVWTPGDTFLVLGVALGAGLPFVPSKLNGLYYFADRLVICIWLALLLAACGWQALGNQRRWHVAIAGLGVVISGASLVAGNQVLRPAARAVAALNAVSLPGGRVGFILEDPRGAVGGARRGLSWNPFYWASIGVFRQNDAVLGNAPWMDETILPITATARLPEMQIQALQEPLPTHVQGDLLAAAGERRAALETASFFVVDAFDRPPLDGGEPLLQSDAITAEAWHCERRDWFRICRKAQGGASLGPER